MVFFLNFILFLICRGIYTTIISSPNPSLFTKKITNIHNMSELSCEKSSSIRRSCIQCLFDGIKMAETLHFPLHHFYASVLTAIIFLPINFNFSNGDRKWIISLDFNQFSTPFLAGYPLSHARKYYHSDRLLQYCFLWRQLITYISAGNRF